MKKFNKVLSFLLAMIMVFAMVACGEDTPTTPNTTPSGSKPSGSNSNYVVTVKSIGGMPMADLDVYIYEDSDKGDLKQAGKTNADGQASFTLETKSNYVAVISGAPKGYKVEAYYPFNGSGCFITLQSSLIQGESITGTNFQVGDVMYDFEFTDHTMLVCAGCGEKNDVDKSQVVQMCSGCEQPLEGASYYTTTLSEVLAEKKLVMLNFWYSTCSWCIEEFPVINEVYEGGHDNYEILGLNPYPSDTIAGVQESVDLLGLTFPVGKVDMMFNVERFGSSGYPTTVFIDRYGVICMIEPGAVTNKQTWISLINHFTADDYQQKLAYNGISDLVSTVKPPEVVDPATWPTADQMAAIMNGENTNATYSFEDDEYSWPYLESEFAGLPCLKASNSEFDGSYAIIKMEVELKAGQAVGLDYVISSEFPNDVAVVIVNNKDIYQISGDSREEGWKTCYPWVALEDGIYEVAVCYLKDGSVQAGDDTIYLRNLRIVDAADIDVASYIPREAGVLQADGSYKYADIFFNEEDNYYHVGSVDGPLLMANMMGYTQFDSEDFLWNRFYKGDIKVSDELMKLAEQYANYSLNSALTNYVPVTKELAELLYIVDEQLGFDSEDNMEWLLLCEYYDAYGTRGQQLQDPVKGLAPFSAYKAQVGQGWANAATGEYSDFNCFKYDANRPIMPRGMFAEFIPEKSGVYMITSDPSITSMMEGWLFNYNREDIYTAVDEYRNVRTDSDVTMVYYMEAGKSYYVNIAFYDLYEGGYIPFTIEYLGETFDLLRAASPATFTFDEQLAEQGAYEIIAGGIKVVMDEEGYYRHDLGKDADGNQIYGSYIYVTFTDITAVISLPIYAEGPENDLIDRGAFSFAYTEMDEYILAILAMYDGDVDAAREHLREEWKEEFEERADKYDLERVLAGGATGSGVDYTDVISSYIDDLYSSGELAGCVKVNAELAEVLQKLMDKYTFNGVDFSWLKLCYYYDYMGR